MNKQTQTQTQRQQQSTNNQGVYRPPQKENQKNKSKKEDFQKMEFPEPEWVSKTIPSATPKINFMTGFSNLKPNEDLEKEDELMEGMLQFTLDPRTGHIEKKYGKSNQIKSKYERLPSPPPPLLYKKWEREMEEYLELYGEYDFEKRYPYWGKKYLNDNEEIGMNDESNCNYMEEDEYYYGME